MLLDSSSGYLHDMVAVADISRTKLLKLVHGAPFENPQRPPPHVKFTGGDSIAEEPSDWRRPHIETIFQRYSSRGERWRSRSSVTSGQSLAISHSCVRFFDKTGRDKQATHLLKVVALGIAIGVDGILCILPKVWRWQ